MESALHTLTEQVRAAAAHPRPLRIRGGAEQVCPGQTQSQIGCGGVECRAGTMINGLG